MERREVLNITDLLSEESILLSLEEVTKVEAITALVDTLYSDGGIKEKGLFLADVLKREAQSTTGIGNGVAIPHAKSRAVTQVGIALARSHGGIEFNSLDGEKAHLIFLIAVPEKADELHLDILAKLSTILMNKETHFKLMTAESKSDLLSIISELDKDDTRNETYETNEETPFILAVTGCPTGIAHTYMAAHSLESAAATLHIPLKVETNGAAGVKQHITKAEIEKATAIIIAADTKVELERFSGKHMVQASVADGMSKPFQLLEKAVSQDCDIYDHNHVNKNSKTWSRELYQHVMNGLSNMLPLAIAAGFLLSLTIFSSDFRHQFWEILSFFGDQTIIVLLMPIFAGYIGKSISDRPGFAPGAIGGLFAAMNGSGLIGGICAGLIGGFIINRLKKWTNYLPSSITAMSNIIIYPVIGILMTLLAMFVLLQPLTWLTQSITTLFQTMTTPLSILIGAMFGLLMAIDLGGPINKMTYLVGIGFMLNGVYEPLAAIMVGGMVPPLAIAFATSIFYWKFSKNERLYYRTNYVKGFLFMTEGAIPFVERNKKAYIPPILIGSATAGALSMATHTGIAIPHGGVLVTPFVFGSSLSFLLAIAVGSLFAALLLGTIKRKPNVE